MINVRKAQERGHFSFEWLDTFHTFSFGEYRDSKHMGFRSLRVINEDRIEAGKGFGTHPHKDMEILTYLISGSLEHKDSMGNGSVINPGDVQRMSAGTGVTHSEYNPSPSKPAHLYQIWLYPAQKGVEPGYEQKFFEKQEMENTLKLVASQTGDAGSVTIHQDVKLYASILSQSLTYSLGEHRHCWIQTVTGKLQVNDETLTAGDGVAISEESTVTLSGNQSEFLLFDLA